MLATIESINNVVNNFIWGVPAMICIVGVGLLLSIRTGFLQIRKFPYAMKVTIGRMLKKREASDGALTPFQAVCTALAATVGTGNIAGVAGAIAIGAVFWMWISALLGMCTKFSEVTLAVHFREKNAEGDLVGGPMYYIKNGLKKQWHWLAYLFAAFGVLTVFGTGNATQVNTITTAIDSALYNYGVISEQNVSTLNLVIGIILSMALGSMAAVAKYKADGILSLVNQDKDNALNSVDISEYDTVSDSDVINILLVGADKNLDEQDSEGAARRSDSMMIATLDMKHKKLKVTSLMRDMYVEIPGYGKNKFNAAYSFGGIKLLYKTIASNFGIKLDGYAEVNFDAFIDVINAVGGVEATLTESEATNLNDTNYIRRKKYRNVKVGTQVLNGYQALGYCRIRHGKWKNGHYPAVLTASGKGDDYGRTERQRLVVQALLKKVKSLSVDKWMELIDVILPNVTTDLDKDSIYSYVLAVVKMGTTDIKQYHLPADGAYTSEKINGADCLVVDVEKNKKALSDFIYEK